jgi:hypothetical protein
MAVWLLSLRAGRPLLPGSFLILIVRVEGLHDMKNSITSSDIEPATFLLAHNAVLTSVTKPGIDSDYA